MSLILDRVKSEGAGNRLVFKPLRQHPGQKQTHRKGAQPEKPACRFTDFGKATSLTCNPFIAVGLFRLRQFNLLIEYRP